MTMLVRNGEGAKQYIRTTGEGTESSPFTPTHNDFRYQVALGRIEDATTWNKFGYNSDVDSGSPEIIASFGGTFSVMTTADTLDVVSSSANDTSEGTGARSIQIIGIGSDNLTQTEVVVLNGTDAVTTVNEWLGVNRVIVLSSGSSNYNEGIITLTDTGGSFGAQAQVPAEGSVTQQAIFHTQQGFRFLADWLFINVRKLSGGTAPRVTVKGYSYSRVTQTRYEVFREDIDTNIENSLVINPSQPFPIGGREVFYFEAETSSDNTIVNCRFSGQEIAV